MRTARIIGTALLTFFFAVFVALDLLVFGVVPLDSAVLTIVPAVGLVLGAVLGAIIGRRRVQPSSATEHGTPAPWPAPPAGPVT